MEMCHLVNRCHTSGGSRSSRLKQKYSCTPIGISCSGLLHMDEFGSSPGLNRALRGAMLGGYVYWVPSEHIRYYWGDSASDVS